MSLEALYIIDKVFESLDITSWMCGFQFRFSSIIMPRNLDDCTLVTFIVFMIYLDLYLQNGYEIIYN